MPVPETSVADEYDLVGIDRLLGTPNNPDAPPAAAPTAAAPAVSEPPPPAHLPPRDESGRFTKPSPFSIRMAKSLGMSDEDIAAVEDPHILEARVEERYRVQEQARDEYTRSREQIETLAARQQPAAPQQVSSPPSGSTGTQPAFDHGLTEQNCTPEIIAAFNKMANRVQELERDHGEVKSHIQRAVAAQSDNEIDQGFAALGSKYEKLFGSGTGVDLKATDPAKYRRRVAVLADIRANPPKTPTSIKALVAGRGAELFKDLLDVAPTATPAAEPTAISPQQWAEGGVHRPTQRISDVQLNGDQKATRGVAEKMAAMAAINGTGGAGEKFVP